MLRRGLISGGYLPFVLAFWNLFAYPWYLLIEILWSLILVQGFFGRTEGSTSRSRRWEDLGADRAGVTVIEDVRGWANVVTGRGCKGGR